MTTPSLDTSFFAFVPDVREVGTDEFCGILADGIGVSGVTVAVAYHASRDFRPRNRTSRVAEFPAGAHYFAPDDQLYAASPIKPWCPPEYAAPDVLAQLRTETRRRDMALTAWTVFGFNERVGRSQPEFAQINAYGDHYVTDLCPANPGYREYATALAADVVRYEPDWVLAESLHYHPLREGRRFLRLDPWSRLALGLCFCAHCEQAAADAGVDVAALRRWARSVADQVFDGTAEAREGTTLDRSAVNAVLDGALAAFLAVRAGIVADVAAAVAGTVRAGGSRLCFMDQAGADERILGTSVVEDAWRYGVDVARIGQACDGYQVLGYAPEAAEVASAVGAYRSALGDDVHLRMALRPAWPDCTTTANLVDKIDVATTLGVRGVDFYHYGLVSGDALRRVGEWLGRP
jgi:hypothetical protein